jgi:uncharacterized protein YkwD
MMRRWPLVIGFAIVLLLVAAVIHADEDEVAVVLRDGRRLIGRLIELPDGRVTIKMRLGAVTLDGSEVLRVEPHESIANELARRRSALAPGDQAGLLELARWAATQRLTLQAHEFATSVASGEGPLQLAAQRLIVGWRLDQHLRQPGNHLTAEAIASDFARYREATQLEIAARYLAEGRALAASLGDGALTPEAAVTTYRETRALLLGTVRAPNFARSKDPATRQRAAHQAHHLRLLYLATTSQPFLRLQVELGDAGLEGAFKADCAIDRTAIDQMLELRQAARIAIEQANANDAGPDALERQLISLINDYRDMLGLNALRLEARLGLAAARHTRAMRELAFFAHDSPLRGQRQPSDRVGATGYPWAVVGEVLARHSEDPEAVFLAFLASPAHHHALIVPEFREVGIARSGDYWTIDMAHRR